MAATNTPDRCIQEAMVNAGKLGNGQVPNSAQYADNLIRLKNLINFLQTQGLKLWTQEEVVVTLVAGTAKYTAFLGGSINIVKPMRFLQGYYKDSNNIKRPIYPLSRDEYMRLSQTTQQGPVNNYFVDKKATEIDVYMWLVPNTQAATGTVVLLAQQQITQPTTLTETLNFPEEWFNALAWGLADEICTGQPQAIMDRCEKRATMYREALEGWDVEDASTSFAPDQRASMGTTSFR